MKRRIDYEAKDRQWEARRDAEQEIRAISAVADHLIRQEKAATGADALLMAIDLVRSVNVGTVAA